jgi:hypothetical protein
VYGLGSYSRLLPLSQLLRKAQDLSCPLVTTRTQFGSVTYNSKLWKYAHPEDEFDEGELATETPSKFARPSRKQPTKGGSNRSLSCHNVSDRKARNRSCAGTGKNRTGPTSLGKKTS